MTMLTSQERVPVLLALLCLLDYSDDVLCKEMIAATNHRLQWTQGSTHHHKRLLNRDWQGTKEASPGLPGEISGHGTATS